MAIVNPPFVKGGWGDLLRCILLQSGTLVDCQATICQAPFRLA